MVEKQTNKQGTNGRAVVAPAVAGLEPVFSASQFNTASVDALPLELTADGLRLDFGTELCAGEESSPLGVYWSSWMSVSSPDAEEWTETSSGVTFL